MCDFHLEKVQCGGFTSFYSGDKPDLPGEQIYQVSFRHGTLQIGLSYKVSNGVDDCGMVKDVGFS